MDRVDGPTMMYQGERRMAASVVQQIKDEGERRIAKQHGAVYGLVVGWVLGFASAVGTLLFLSLEIETSRRGHTRRDHPSQKILQLGLRKRGCLDDCGLGRCGHVERSSSGPTGWRGSTSENQ